MPDSWASVPALAALLLIASGPAPGWCQDADPAPKDPDPPAWEGSVALGGSVRGGDQSRYAGNADLNLSDPGVGIRSPSVPWPTTARPAATAIRRTTGRSYRGAEA